jgi:hypothetical protein
VRSTNEEKKIIDRKMDGKKSRWTEEMDGKKSRWTENGWKEVKMDRRNGWKKADMVRPVLCVCECNFFHLHKF